MKKSPSLLLDGLVAYLLLFLARLIAPSDLTFAILMIAYPIIKYREYVIESFVKWKTRKFNISLAFIIALGFLALSAWKFLDSNSELYNLTFHLILPIVARATSEEILFRAFILRLFFERFDTPRANEETVFDLVKTLISILIVSFLFMFAHISSELTIQEYGSLFYSGFIYGFIYYLSGKNVILSSVVHSIHNMITT